MSGFDFDISVVTATSYKERKGFLGLQVAGNGTPEDPAGINPGEPLFPLGLKSRPLDPALDADGRPLGDQVCQALITWEGGKLHVLPTFDPRWIKKLPEINKGDTLLYCANAPMVRLNAVTGTVTLMTTADNSEGGTSSFYQQTGQGFIVTSENGTMALDDFGWRLTTRVGVTMRAMYLGAPGLHDGMNASFKLSAQNVFIEGGLVKIGRGAAGSVVKSDPLAAFLSTLATTIATGLSATGAPTGAAAAAAFTATMTPIITALASAMRTKTQVA